MSLSPQFLRALRLNRDDPALNVKFPFTLPALRTMARIDFHPKVTYFVGENGSGKSTVLEAIAISLGFNPEGGTKNFRFSTAHSHSDLHEHIVLEKGYKQARDGYFLRAESFFNVASEIERLDAGPGGPPIKNSYGGKSLHACSHGESFLALMTERFGGNSIFLLDEPEAALSPQRQLAALRRMHELVQSNSQFIIATHSPILMAYPDSMIYSFDEEGISITTYEETEHYQVTHDFMKHPARFVSRLLDD